MSDFSSSLSSSCPFYQWYGAPPPMFCGPRSEHPHTGFWNYNYECKCTAYYDYDSVYMYIHTLIIHCMLTVLLPCFHQATKDGRTLLSLVMCTKTKRRASMTIRVHMPTQVSAFVNRSYTYINRLLHTSFIEDSTHTHQIFCSFFCIIFVYLCKSI